MNSKMGILCKIRRKQKIKRQKKISKIHFIGETDYNRVEKNSENIIRLNEENAISNFEIENNLIIGTSYKQEVYNTRKKYGEMSNSGLVPWNAMYIPYFIQSKKSEKQIQNCESVESNNMKNNFPKEILDDIERVKSVENLLLKEISLIDDHILKKRIELDQVKEKKAQVVKSLNKSKSKQKKNC